MKNLADHIEALDVLMKEKGYDGYFLSNSTHPDKLKESLTAYLQEALQNKPDIPAIHLSTYSHWKDEARPYVKCDFKMKYDPEFGFRLEKMEVTRANCYGMMKSLALRPETNQDIPTREQVNALVGQKKKCLRI